MTEEKPTLKVEKKILFKVNYSDLDDFISKVYNQEFEFAVAEESSNDTSHEFGGIDGVIDEYDEKQLAEFIKDGNYNYCARIIIQDLCRRKLIEPGDYLINVCW